MEIVVTARHTAVSDRFRRHLEEKLAKVEQIAPRTQRLDVEVSHESNPRQAHTCERVEITVRAKGPVIRAEACADDPYAALDMAQEKLLERLRRARDRRKVHHGRHNPRSVAEATRDLPPPVLNGTGPASRTAAEASTAGDAGDTGEMGESPVVIREKLHAATPMTLDDALYQMELVGHDFFLFLDSSSGCPSVVYRRKGWSYGVIRLSESAAASADEEDVAATG
ncbi:MAG TPA: ribosome-associated translation inhibitor RaiA [Actinomycetales bacterium]|nr:ribosome-associated translation inhibitor RaiA [Actinomycetales bacterium]